MPASRLAIVIAGAGECGTRAAFARREAPGGAALADPGVALKSLLRAPVGA